jgi:hypothetical protein
MLFSACHCRQISVVVFMDISHFFDSLDLSLMEWILLHLRVDGCMGAWTQSLMADRKVSLHINRFISEGFQPGWGTLQGSPASPIISALFTPPLLHATQGWEHADFSLYVDDGVVFASGPTFNSVASHTVDGMNQVLQWLHCLGLTINRDKTEALFFHLARPSMKHLGSQLHGLMLWDGTRDCIHVTPSTSLRYLRVFFTPHLSWSLHIKTLATHARSTVCMLGVLGNSICSFLLLWWHRIFQVVIVPVLTYRVQVWFTDHHQGHLISMLQVIQNEACRKLGSFFCTMPVNLLHNLLAIPPSNTVPLPHFCKVHGIFPLYLPYA